ncbi:glycoside hydrolase 3 protein [Lignoscripta atroalba]|nr:glycoside hydrolase 3 protein [Lignoscripta atroalba]
MRFSNIIPVALAATPLAVSAAGTLGFAIGDKMPNGVCKSTADYEADFDALESTSTVVRTYSANECNTAQQILPAAAGKGFKVVLGVWPDSDAAYAADKAALQSALSNESNAAAVYAITVGSEALYRGTLTADALLSKIQDMQETFPDILIGTADSWNKYQDGTADPIITGGVKLLLVNAFAYWQGQEITNGSHTYLDDLAQAFGHIQSLAGSTDAIELWNGETGWPADGGSDYEAATASTENTETFYKQGVCAALNWGYNVFYFEAFDEPWKPASVGDTGASGDETHWGAFTSDRTAKFSLSC